MFNEGYAAHNGERLVLPELCGEAVRLAEIIADHPVTGTPKARALTALLLLQGARLPARADHGGDIILLEDQDRRLWETSWIARGIKHLDAAADGGEVSEYHLLAGIAASHSLAPDYESTDWGRIVGYYDALQVLAPSPVVALNRAVVGHDGKPPVGNRRPGRAMSLSVEIRGAGRRWLMMLCCLHDGFNGTVGLSLSQVFLESISEDGQLAIGLEATEGFLGLQQAAAVHLSAISACLQL